VGFNLLAPPPARQLVKNDMGGTVRRVAKSGFDQGKLAGDDGVPSRPTFGQGGQLNEGQAEVAPQLP